jgi:hypothetical protein
VPSALQRISEVGIENLAPVGQTMSMKLSFIARPDNLIWPSQTPKLGETFKNVCHALKGNGWPMKMRPPLPSGDHYIITALSE